MATGRRSRSRSNLIQSEETDNPSNWTVAVLKQKLSDLGIVINVPLSHSALKRIYLDNVRITVNAASSSSTLLNPVPFVADPSSVNAVGNPGTTHIPNSNADRQEQTNGLNPDFARQSGSSLLLPNATSLPSTITMADSQAQNVLISTLQLCQQAISTLGNNMKKTTEERTFNLSTAISNAENGTPSSQISTVDLVSPEVRADIVADGPISSASSRRRQDQHSLPIFERSNLDSVVNNLWNHSISNKTRAQYEVGLDTYVKFTLLRGIHKQTDNDLPPISEQMLIYFVAHCDDYLHLSYSTIKLYLSGIRFFYLKMKGFNPLEHVSGQLFESLQTVLNGVKKKQACTYVKRTRLPITSSILSKICQLLHSGIFDTFTCYLLEAACTVAFFGFLRCGEFTVQSESNSDDCLSTQDVKCFENSIVINLKQSKTDPFRKGVQIQLFKTNRNICPVSAMIKYLELKARIFPFIPTPLFVTKDGSVLTRAYFIDRLKFLLSKLGFNPDNYNGHSFRIGAATTAQEARIEDHIIKSLGRWSSNCYTTYIHKSSTVIQQAQKQLAMTEF